MKAPEKIYVKITHPISDEYTEIIAFEDGDGIEYVRTDAFIDKAISWLKEQDEIIGVSFQEDFLERFKNYMKGKQNGCN